MAYSAVEIESIVRRVLAQLVDSAAPKQSDTTPSNNSIPSRSTESFNSNETKEFHRIEGRIISIDSLKSAPKEIKSIRVGRKAIVTPAATDWLKERGINLIRNELSLPQSNKLTPLYVAGTPKWIAQLPKQVCPKQATIAPPSVDDSAAIFDTKGEVRKGRRLVVLVAEFAHATCWQAARDESLRPVVVSDWKTLQTILDEVPANLLILPSQAWPLHATANAIRRIYSLLAASSLPKVDSARTSKQRGLPR